MARTCGNRTHWYRCAPYRWGHCDIELPWWIVANEEIGRSPILFPDQQGAELCAVFEEVAEQEAHDDTG